jgi:hypothetical protein
METHRKQLRRDYTNICVVAHIAGLCKISHIYYTSQPIMCLLNTIPEEKQYNMDVLESDNSEEDFGTE